MEKKSGEQYEVRKTGGAVVKKIKRVGNERKDSKLYTEELDFGVYGVLSKGSCVR